MSETAVRHQDFDNSTVLTPDNLNGFIKGLPFKVQLIFRGLMHIDTGSLTLILPDGRKANIRGPKPGPEALIKLANWNLFTRSITGGAIAAWQDPISTETGKAQISASFSNSSWSTRRPAAALPMVRVVCCA